ncbi:STN domain-containing protein [Heliophilum fasciatum]|uniref:Type IV pilus assembly protein PilQ n=1 Tax=Heliophilum fasciatum TaxID=35700 RepID=A0A4R2RS79_9FIRM|nr:STN domain-containing protein [Heliophilum fasciatum]MCW2277274.1 type IV pilus assembly protein PilQ [Heliophilum fasciatum]TCP67112.1 type IV pilus assembly protein PilQ [Heliophilum fasciatum]
MMVVKNDNVKKQHSAARLPTWAVTALCVGVCATALTLTPLPQASAYSGTEILTASETDSLSSGSKISMDVRNVDMRDVLSALALKMGVNIILVDTEAVEITFQTKNVTPRQALELLIQTHGYAYIEQGGVIVVGESGTLNDNFFNQMIVTRFDTVNVKAKKAMDLINALGIPLKAVSLDSNEYVFWAQGTVQSMQKVQEVIYSIDRPENAETPTMDITLEYRTINTQQIPPDRAVKLLDDIGIKFKHYVKLQDRVLVFDKDWFSKWDQIDVLLAQLDNQGSKDQTSFNYQLKNIVAKDAKSRLAEFNLGADVKAISYNNDRFAKDIMIICPTYMENQVRSALASLDLSISKTRVPVATSPSFTGLNTQRTLLSELSGVALSSFNISGDIGTTDQASGGTPKYVLWVEETPDKIQMIKDLADEM